MVVGARSGVLFACAAASLAAQVHAHAQQPMGTMRTSDARVSGNISVVNANTTLLSNATVTAYDHAASVQLARGGEALVCATSDFHILHAGTGNGLLFGLDRGAFQIASASQPQDVVLTPDIRFTVAAPGAFDLRVRVTRDGDTCVENRGSGAPVLLLTNSFGDTTYRVLPNQHVLFEHGDLRQVVDNERSPCGCPAAAPGPAPLAANATPAERAAAEHPFPEAASQGLMTAPDKPPTLPTEGGVRASTEFRINGGDKTGIALTTTAPDGATVQPPPDTGAAGSSGSATPPPAPPGAHAIAHSLGHFFHHLFHPHAK